MLFFELFDVLSVDLKTRKLFEPVRVLGYKRMNDSDHVIINLESDRFIPREFIRKMESILLNQYDDASISRIKISMGYSFAKNCGFEELWGDHQQGCRTHAALREHHRWRQGAA